VSDPDPIRVEVERRLRAVAEATVMLPLTTMRAVDACVRRRIDSARGVVQRPMQVVRSLIDLVAGAAAPTNVSEPPARVIDVTEAAVAPADFADAPIAENGDADDLPIEAYESLAASHVVARLEALSPSELEQVREFEAGHRGRRTVLGKIDQLLGSA
jgi:hypothetical protein